MPLVLSSSPRAGASDSHKGCVILKVGTALVVHDTRHAARGSPPIVDRFRRDLRGAWRPPASGSIEEGGGHTLVGQLKPRGVDPAPAIKVGEGRLVTLALGVVEDQPSASADDAM